MTNEQKHIAREQLGKTVQLMLHFHGEERQEESWDAASERLASTKPALSALSEYLFAAHTLYLSLYSSASKEQ